MRGLAALASLTFAALGLCAGPAAAAPARPPAWMGWEKQNPQPRTYRVGGFTLKTSVEQDPEGAMPVLTVVTAGRRPLRVPGVPGLASAYAGFLVFPAERPRGQSVILFRSYSGGAHCCDIYKLIEPTPSGWRVHRAGSWDGAGPEPQDADGDGRLELVARDQRFDYRLTSHAESAMPPVVFVVRDGRLVEVTREPRFRALFVKALPQLRTACMESDSPLGPCLGYVAVAARAGEAKRALQLLDGRPDKAEFGDAWEVPERCGGTPAGCAHEKPTRKFKARREAVVHFLTDLGYLPEAKR